MEARGWHLLSSEGEITIASEPYFVDANMAYIIDDNTKESLYLPISSTQCILIHNSNIKKHREMDDRVKENQDTLASSPNPHSINPGTFSANPEPRISFSDD